MGNLACFSLFVTDLQELKDRVQRKREKKSGGEREGTFIFTGKRGLGGGNGMAVKCC